MNKQLLNREVKKYYYIKYKWLLVAVPMVIIAVLLLTGIIRISGNGSSVGVSLWLPL
jgi:predicted anti-sigma-YlaC factor YlaD